MGAVILPLMGLYFVLLIVATRLGWRFAEKKGWKKRWLGAALGFLIVYLPVLGDWIPTVLAHKYYCATEAGFWEYKTLDQWKAENPGVMEGLRSIDKPTERVNYGNFQRGSLQVLDERFAIGTHKRSPIPFLPTEVFEDSLLDRKTGKILAKNVNVGSGVGYMALGGGYKFWLNQEPCISEGIWSIVKNIKSMRGEK